MTRSVPLLTLLTVSLLSLLVLGKMNPPPRRLRTTRTTLNRLRQELKRRHISRQVREFLTPPQ